MSRAFAFSLPLLFVWNLWAQPNETVFTKAPTDSTIQQALQEIRSNLEPQKEASREFLRDTCAEALDAGLLSGGGLQNLLKKNVTVLLVPGYLNSRQVKFVDLFAPQMRVLKRLGIPYRLVLYPERASVSNARLLSEEINKINGPVVVISHSEGSALFLKTALINGSFSSPEATGYGPHSAPAIRELCERMGDRYAACLKPELTPDTPPIQDKVVGWISLNGNFGSPLADLITDTENPGPISRRIQKFLSWRPAEVGLSLVQMTPKVIRGYLADKASDITALNQKLPILSFASWFEREPEGEAGVLGVRQGFSDFVSALVTEANYPANDSIVPVQNQIVPGSEFVIAGNTPHYLMVKDYNRTWYLPWTKGKEIVPASEATTVLLDMLGNRLR